MVVPQENREVKRIGNKRKQNQDDSETPHKKQKSDDEDTEPKRKKKYKENDTEEPEVGTKKKKKNKQQNEEIENPDVKKKKKKRNDTESSQENIDTDDTQNDSKKKKKKRNDTESSQENTDTHDLVNENIKKKKKHSISEEESDAIETDFQDEELLTPHEQGLLDMSDCSTLKQYKKRMVSLLKSIKARARRIDVIDTKIQSLEERGLTAKNKKYHTAMQTEKLVIQERTKKLLEALNVAQEKLKEMGYEKDDSYKEEQKKRKKEKMKLEKEKVKEEKSEKKKGREVIKDKLSDIKVVESLEPTLEVPSAKDFWSVDTHVVSKNVEEEESSSSEDEVSYYYSSFFTL